MTPATSTATTKSVAAMAGEPRLRRWPLLWTASFAIGVSVVLWAGIFMVAGWVLSLGSTHV